LIFSLAEITIIKVIEVIIIGINNNFLKLKDDENKNIINKINNAKDVLSPLNTTTTKEAITIDINRNLFVLIELLKHNMVKKIVNGNSLIE
tara:strand:- start:4 stop:276 length:273 start_codon:yes stop_codon:yes gene_type:complete